MEGCPHGSEAKPGAPPDGGVVYFSNLGFPSGTPSPAIQGFDGRNLTLNIASLLGQFNYDLFPLNAREDITIDGFCSSPPTAADVAPGLPAAVAGAALDEMQQRWNQHCQCSLPPPPPGCVQLGGVGQCACVVYRVRFKVDWEWPKGTFNTRTMSPVFLYGPIT